MVIVLFKFKAMAPLNAKACLAGGGRVQGVCVCVWYVVCVTVSVCEPTCVGVPICG